MSSDDEKTPKFIPPGKEIQSSEIPEEIKKQSETDKPTVSSKELVKPEEEAAAAGGGGDGFTTPTSSEHKIPPVTDCPPAPKKARPQSSKLKRKAASSSPPHSRRRIPESDASTEVESIFRPISSPDSVEDQPQVKRPRKMDDGD